MQFFNYSLLKRNLEKHAGVAILFIEYTGMHFIDEPEQIIHSFHIFYNQYSFAHIQDMVAHTKTSFSSTACAQAAIRQVLVARIGL